MANEKTTAVKTAGTVANATGAEYEKAKVVKDGVKCLAQYLGYDDYTKIDEDSGEIKYSYAYSFLRYDGRADNGQYVSPEVVKFFEKSTEHDYLRTAKPMVFVGLSVTITQFGKDLRTSVKSILSDTKTSALKEIYEVE